MNAAEMLRVHREVWDMPTLAETQPEVIEWLAARYEVVFPEDFTGQVYVVTKSTGAMERMGTTDVREAVATLLEREGRCHCGAPARSDGSDYDGYVCTQWPTCEAEKAGA